MTASFESNAYPGRPKILFLGFAESTHTHAWIDLLEGAQFNVRLFALPSGGVPPDNWHTRTYVTSYDCPPLNPATRARLYSSTRVLRFAKRNVARLRGAPGVNEVAGRWLARVIRQWRPDIIHTLGLDPAGDLYFEVRRRFQLEQVGKWVLQTRGGSDLALSHLNPALAEKIGERLRACDQLLSDNQQNFRIARELGVREDQLSRIGPVPGTGGIETEALRASGEGKPSRRRVILWPKAYDTPWGKATPIFEAIKLCWERIQPFRLHLLAMNEESRMWYWTLPEGVREFAEPYERIPRAQALELMSQARVMLAPSLVDGVPNSMYEAMAAGALPIVSPLETIRPVVEHERNVLFARNLYPQEIADALTRAMTDDKLVDEAAETNLALVRRIANRSEIRSRVINFYEELAREKN